MAVPTIVLPTPDGFEEIVKPTGQEQSALDRPGRASPPSFLR